MKKILLTLFAIVPLIVAAQIKPSIPKAEKALREGKLDEAKAIIDATVGSQEFMVDKKGQPTKNAARAWYMKGLVYCAIDTTSKQQFKSLSENPFAAAKEAFDKCYEIDGGKTDYFIKDAGGVLPILNTQVNNVLANTYYNKAIMAYNSKTDDKDQKEKNARATYDNALKTLYFIPNDTSVLLYTGGVFAPNVKEYDKGIELLRRYIKAGGTSPEGYAMIAGIYRDFKKDLDNALKVLQEGKAKYPNYKNFSIDELHIYLTQKKYDVARTMVENELKTDPNNKDSYYLYGQLCRELGDPAKAKEAFKKVLEIDPKHQDATVELATLYWTDAKVLKDEMGKLGNSKADMEKLKGIDAKYVEKLKIYLPYIEACEKLLPDDISVLYSLLNVYTDLDDTPKVARVKKRLKTLGEDVN